MNEHRVSQVCTLDLLHCQKVSFHSVSSKGKESKDSHGERSYLRRWLKRSFSEKDSSHWLATLYSSGHPFYFRAAYYYYNSNNNRRNEEEEEQEETLVVTANVSKDPCHVVKYSSAAPQVWKPEWPESNELQVGLLCLIADNGKFLCLVDPCSVRVRVYSLESRELCCFLNASDIQWRGGMVVAATVTTIQADALSVLLLSDSLQLYCISLPLEEGCCSSEKRLSTVRIKLYILVCILLTFVDLSQEETQKAAWS